jgi:hypothetical protein
MAKARATARVRVMDRASGRVKAPVEAKANLRATVRHASLTQ